MKGNKKISLYPLFLIVLVMLIPSFVLFAGGNKELQGRLNNCNTKVDTLESENSNLKSENSDLKARNDEQHKQITDLNADKQKLEKQIADMQAQIDKWVAEMKKYGIEPEEPSIVSKTVEESLQAKDAKIVQLESNIEAKQKELDRTKRELEQVKYELEQLKSKQSQAEKDAEQLKIENSLYERKVNDLEEENQELHATLTMYEGIQQEATQLMDIALERIQKVLKDEIERGDVRIFKGTLGLTIDIVSTFMFDTGSVEISPKGKVILGKIATLLHDLDGYFIGVIGNADSRPIVTPALKKKYPTNWELSSTRGAVVVRFILDNSNLSPGRIIAMGLGEYQPIDSNNTDNGRGNNRRVDIVLLPVDVLASVVIGAEIK